MAIRVTPLHYLHVCVVTPNSIEALGIRFARNVQHKEGGRGRGVVRIGLPCERQKTWEDMKRRAEILHHRHSFRITIVNETIKVKAMFTL